MKKLSAKYLFVKLGSVSKTITAAWIVAASDASFSFSIPAAYSINISLTEWLVPRPPLPHFFELGRSLSKSLSKCSHIENAERCRYASSKGRVLCATKEPRYGC
jgi:hypothetical protein